jgi:hypothetical protein
VGDVERCNRLLSPCEQVNNLILPYTRSQIQLFNLQYIAIVIFLTARSGGILPQFRERLKNLAYPPTRSQNNFLSI